jgi:hypothetical protein
VTEASWHALLLSVSIGIEVQHSIKPDRIQA